MAYERSARLYDKIYGFKNYEAEVDGLKTLIQTHASRPYHALLDVGCGTGEHLRLLRDSYICAGVDFSEPMLAAAHEKLPDLSLTLGDMRTFDLHQTFDVVICLFSAIGYMATPADLDQAVANMAHHVAVGGLLIVEAWLHPGQFTPGHLGMLTIDEPDFKLARMNTSWIDGRLSLMDMHHLISMAAGIEYFVERHSMGLFTSDEYVAAFERTGLRVTVDPVGFAGRTLYIASR